MTPALPDEGASRPPSQRRWHLWLAAVWSGGTVMGFELIGARLLAPAFGTGIEVWSTVIATTLGAMAVGYWLGGRWIDARPSEAVLAIVLLLAAASLLAVRVATVGLINAVIALPFTTALCVASIGILSFPLLLLGMVQPMLARLLLPTTERAGRTVGGLLAAGTIGAVAGTLLTGLILIPDAGVSRTLLVFTGGTSLLGILVLFRCRRLLWAGVALIPLATATGAGTNIPASTCLAGPMKVIERIESRSGRLEVLKYNGMRALACDGVFQAAMPTEIFAAGQGALLRSRDYTELIPWFRPQARTAMLIGLGGGLHVQMLAAHGITVQAVEIDPAVVELAARHFSCVADVTIADARAFLARNQRRYDAVVLDAFVGSSVPEHLYTREAFALMQKCLGNEAILAIHLIATPQHPATRAVMRTLQAVFAHTTAARSGIGAELQHLYLFASDAPLELLPEQRLDLYRLDFTGQEFCDIETVAAPLLTDDCTCLSRLTRDIAIEHRLQSLARRRSPSW